MYMCMFIHTDMYVHARTHTYTLKHGLSITSKLLVKLCCQLVTTSERLSTLT